jgi:hypothetical protein
MPALRRSLDRRGSRPGSRWEDIIKMDNKEVEWRDVNWIFMNQDRDQ